MPDNLFNIDNIVTDNMSDKDKENIMNDASQFFDDDDKGDNITFTPTRSNVTQGQSNVQNVDEIIKNKDRESSEEIDNEDLFFGEDDNKDKEKTDTKDKTDSTSSKETDKSDKSTDSETLVINKFAKVLKERGIITVENEEDLSKIKDYEDFEKAVEETIKNKEYSDLNDDQKEYLDALREGVPQDYIIKHQNIMNQLNNITEDVMKEDDNIATQVYITYLKQKGFNAEKAKSFAETAVEKGKLLEESKDALQELKSIQQTSFEKERESKRTIIENQKREELKVRDTVKDLLTSEKEELVPGFKVSKKEGNEIYTKMNTASELDSEGNKVTPLQKFAKENPAKYKAVVNYLFYSGFFTDGVKDSKIFNKAKNKAIEEFNSILGKDEKTLRDGAAVDTSEERDVLEALDSIL